MDNLFKGQKQQTLEGGISQTNPFKDTIDRIAHQGQMDERFENMQRARTLHDLQMERSFQNMKINEENMINMNSYNPYMEQSIYDRVWNQNQNQIPQINQNEMEKLNYPRQMDNNFNNQNFYNPMMNMSMPTQIHPMLLQFNNEIQNIKSEEKIVEDKNENKGEDILDDIINTMEGQEDERHLNSEFLKFIKRIKTGEIKLNEKENNIDVTDDKNMNSELNINGDYDEQKMNYMWNNLENQMKGTNFDDNNEQDPINYKRDNLFLKDNPFIGINENNGLNKDLNEYSKEMLEKGDIQNARFALEAEVNKNPDNAEAWLILGKIHTENDRDDLAMECFLRSLEADPFNADALLNLGISCTNEFDEFEAMVHLRNWIKLHHIYNKYFDNNNPLLNYEMIRHEMLGDRNDEDYYTKAVRIEGLKQNFYREMGNLMENISMNEKVPDTDLWIAMGIAHFIPHQNDRAIECFRKAVEANPKDYNAWNKLGAILAHSKMNDEAINTYKKAIQLKPNYARCWANLGIAYFNIDNYDESMRSFLSALKIYKDINHVWSYMSSVTIALKRNDLYELVHNKNLQELLNIYKV